MPRDQMMMDREKQMQQKMASAGSQRRAGGGGDMNAQQKMRGMALKNRVSKMGC